MDTRTTVKEQEVQFLTVYVFVVTAETLAGGCKWIPLAKGRCPATNPTEVHSCTSTVVNVYSAGLETQRMNESHINCQQASGADMSSDSTKKGTILAKPISAQNHEVHEHLDRCSVSSLAPNHITPKPPVCTSNTKLMKSHVTASLDMGAKMSYSHSYCHCATVGLPWRHLGAPEAGRD